MTPHKGYYSLIQYCPDASRAEAANVGVLLFCPELQFIQAKTAKDHSRVRKFFGNEKFDPARLTAAKQAIEDRLRLERNYFNHLDDLRRFINSRANEIVITEPRPIKVIHPENELNELFVELVGGTARPRRQAVIPELDRALRSPELHDRIRFDEEVTVPVVGTRMRIPYAYQNGKPNLIHPAVFQTDENAAVKHAAFLAYAGDMLRRHKDNQGRESCLIIVSAIPATEEASPRIEDHVQRVFKEYNLEFFRRNRIDELVERVRQQAHAPTKPR